MGANRVSMEATPVTDVKIALELSPDQVAIVDLQGRLDQSQGHGIFAQMTAEVVDFDEEFAQQALALPVGSVVRVPMPHLNVTVSLELSRIPIDQKSRGKRRLIMSGLVEMKSADLFRNEAQLKA